MKNFKRYLFAVVLLFVGLLFVACGENTPDGPVKKTVIKYCNWNFGTAEDNNLTRRRVEAFNKQSKTIRIEIVTPVGGSSYDDFLTTLASGSDLPDVFMVNSVPSAVINKWALDITDLVANDPEWKDVPSSLVESITYNDHVFAIPAGQYYMGLFANYDLIDNYLTGSESAEEKFATGEFTVDEWIETVKMVRDINKTDGTGVIGLNSVGDMINWLPSSLDKTGKTKHFVWNGTSFDFRSELLIDALTKIADLGDTTKQYVFSSIPAQIGEEEPIDNLSQIFGTTSAADVFSNGQMGFIQEGSWANTFENVDFNCSFISYPDAKVISASDYMCISNSTKNKEAAYEVAKFMTFGEEGLKAMYDIIDNNPDAKLSLTGIPLNTKKELSDKWFSYIKMKGLKETFDKVAEGKIEVIVEGNKSTPGFLRARYTFNTGISIEGIRGGALLTIGDFIWDVCSGAISINEYMSKMTAELAARINEEVKKDYEAMGLEYKG